MKQSTTIKRFKNGNFNFALGKEDREEMRRTPSRDMEIIQEHLFHYDMYVVGDPFSLGNFDMGVNLYSTYFDKIYLFPFSCLDQLQKGESVKFYAHELDSEDREMVAQALFG